MLKLTGLIAATATPLHADGDIWLEQIPVLVEFLVERGVDGLYVCGSTGEGVSLTTPERIAVAQQFVQAAGDRMPVVVQVGHNSLAEACLLARHAAEIGATAISATCPSYFKPADVSTLVDCMAEIAHAAPQLPFYYYHIPAITGVALDMVAFLRTGAARIPNLNGLKFTANALHDFLECSLLDGQRFDVLWGYDEMLLPALAVGAQGAVGSTYNLDAPLYHQLIDFFRNGDLEQARQMQARAVHMIRILLRHQALLPALKASLTWMGVNMGPCRLPLKNLTDAQREQLQSDLRELHLLP